MHPELFTLFFRPYAVPSPPDCFSPEAAASRLHLLRRDQLAPLRPSPRMHRSQLRIAPRGPTFHFRYGVTEATAPGETVEMACR